MFPLGIKSLPSAFDNFRKFRFRLFPPLERLRRCGTSEVGSSHRISSQIVQIPKLSDIPTNKKQLLPVSGDHSGGGEKSSTADRSAPRCHSLRSTGLVQPHVVGGSIQVLTKMSDFSQNIYIFLHCFSEQTLFNSSDSKTFWDPRSAEATLTNYLLHPCAVVLTPGH